MKRWTAIAMTGMSVLLASCDGGPGSDPALAPPSSPERTAAQDGAIRALVMDVAAGRACEAIEGSFVPLPEEQDGEARTEQPTIEGRLWVNECSVERRDGELALHAGGRGWQWIERSAEGPFATSFTVRGHVRFSATIDLDAQIDVRYDEEARRALVALTPREPARATLSPIGSIPVFADGGWSGILGGLGGLLGGSPEAQARPMVEEQGAAMIRRMLRDGATFAMDMCTGQLDGALGAVADGSAPPARPYADDGAGLWLDNARVRLRPGGMDLSGPWEMRGQPLSIDVEVEEGDGVEIAVICRAEAERVASEYLNGGTARVNETLARHSVAASRPLAVSVQPGACDAAVLLVTPSQNSAARYRYRIRREGDRQESWAPCRERDPT